MSSTTTLTVREARPGVQLVTLARPQAANALNTEMGRELLSLWRRLAEDSSVRAVVLTGEGRPFCGGADLKERDGMSDEAWSAQHKLFEDMIRAQLACPFPLVAAVNGAAMGGGCELALACDFAWASEAARFGLPEVGLGIIPGLGGTQLLARLVGQARAADLLMSGRHITAAVALQFGLVGRVLPADALLDEALAWAEKTASNAPLSVRALKRLVRTGPALPLETAMELELSEYNALFRTADRREGVAAFNQKRAPQFTGR